MDSLSSHKGPRVRELIEAAGASLLYLPPYSPDFNPIENAFAKLKALLRKAAERTVEGLWTAIGRLVDGFTPSECANYFAAAGYDAAKWDSALEGDNPGGVFVPWLGSMDVCDANKSVRPTHGTLQMYPWDSRAGETGESGG